MGVCVGVEVSKGVDVSVGVGVSVGVAVSVGVGVVVTSVQEGRIRLCRCAATALFEWDKLAPAGRHKSLPVRTSSVRLVSALRSGIGPVS